MNEIPGDGSQLRINTERATIQSDNGDLTLEQEERTGISPDGGDVTTTTTTTSIEIDGEIIHDIRNQIIGKCQECGQFLTYRTYRCCGDPSCNKILCHHHAKLHTKENNFFCLECYRSIRIKRFFLTIAWIFLAPFVERVDQ